MDLSREARFQDDRRDYLLHLLRLRPGMSVLEVGCGPGALSRKLARWLGPESRVIGIDRDSAFIEYARERARKEKIENVRFEAGDALNLPLAEDSVDACTSHAVVEHAPNREFLLQQRRVCRPGGVVSVMNVRGSWSISSNPSYPHQRSRREQELWKPIEESWRENAKESKVGTFGPDLVGLPALFEELGFVSVQVDAIALPVVPDDARHALEYRKWLIDAQWKEDVEMLEMYLRNRRDVLPEAGANELRALIDKRCRDRLAMVDHGHTLWDYRISIVVIFSGTVPKRNPTPRRSRD